jgi:putative colanic acid biosynthesis acetyltransferase WcaF
MTNIDTFTGPSFSIANRMARIVWSVVYILLFRYSPRPFHEYRSFILRVFGAKVGQGVHVYPGAKIWAPWNLELKSECGVADGVDLYCQGKITLGYRSIISQRVFLCAGTHDYTDQGHPLITAPIIIGDHAWVAAEAFIHPGIIIGEGAVIGARAVVTKDMPAWTVCAGHPCKPLKPRIITNNSR